MYEIHQRPSRDLRNKYPEVADIVKAHNDVVITNKGQVDLVLINPEEYEEFKAYRHHKYIAEALKEVEQQKDNPDYWITEDDFFTGLER